MTDPVPGNTPTLNQWLNDQPKTVAEALDRARRLAEINRALHRWCPEPWIRNIRLANVRDGTLVIYASSATALVPLRYRSQSLLLWLNQQYSLNCSQIDAKIAPSVA